MTSHQHPQVFTGRSSVFTVPVPSSSSVLKSTKGHFYVLTELACIIFLSFVSQLFVGVVGWVFCCYCLFGFFFFLAREFVVVLLPLPWLFTMTRQLSCSDW